ncbi:unnamed protein product [Aureobasidium uvarum]|uniref:Cryptic loci regulator 2 N-terminal domain-containing protein n=1 Tax=Aureobasidium uvarum TaxID=2773716 RepID=A0A9N8KDY9_9PEZI|nr:unnamed protein product [Aureobasidium uvarum]
MDPIDIDLSAPIYPSDGTGVVPTEANERIEAAGGFLPALTSALERKLRKPGAHGDAMRAMFGNDQYKFTGQMPVGYAHVRRDPMGRRDIRIYGHPSGRYYNSAEKFLPHVVAMLVFSDHCWCELC